MYPYEVNEVNGFIGFTCNNCKIKKWILKDKYNNLKDGYNYLFCEKMCAISYELRNPHMIIKKNKSDISLQELSSKEIRCIKSI